MADALLNDLINKIESADNDDNKQSNNDNEDKKETWDHYKYLKLSEAEESDEDQEATTFTSPLFNKQKSVVDVLLLGPDGNDDKEENVLSCEGMDALNKLLNEIKSKNIFLLFCGNEDENGNSWCPDCVVAKPKIKKAMNVLKDEKDWTFITVYVGERAIWKDKKNPFRTDERFKVSGVPTLLLYKTQKRLVEGEIKEASAKMLFEDAYDDD